MANIHLTLACGPYDRTLALRDGTVRADGIDLTYVARQPAEIFWRMLQFEEFDIAEMSLSNYASLVDRGNAPFVAIPVFPARIFRHAFIFVNTNSGIREPGDLVGRRGGVPEYTMTAAVYARGMLEHDYGVKPNSIEWVQGRPERVDVPIPSDIRLSQAPPGRDLGELLADGEIDFLISANNPMSFRRGSATVRRLFQDYRTVERDYYERTGIFPIMHTIVIKREVLERYPWTAANLYQAFVEAKDRCYALLSESGSSKATVVWLQAVLEEEDEFFGGDRWPYGIASNYASIEGLLQYSYEQGLTTQKLEVEQLFAPSTMTDIPVSEGQIAR
jgi:4,5-dihydroxyphthalate decarboxylase